MMASILLLAKYLAIILTEGLIQNIRASDLDSLTFQGDNISYSVETFQVIATDTTYSAHPVDIEENILSWSPLQSDVGNYTVRVIAEDLTQLEDTTEFALEVIKCSILVHKFDSNNAGFCLPLA